MKKLLAFLMALIMLLGLMACGAKPEESAPAEKAEAPAAKEEAATKEEAPAASEGAKKTDITILLPNDIDSFDPCASSQLMQAYVLYNTYDSLYRADEDNNIFPIMVEECTNPDELTWVLKIYDGLFFSDGSPITSEDVAFSVERARVSAAGKSLFSTVDAVEIIDDLTISIHTTAPYPIMTTALANNSAMIVSKDYVENEAEADNWANPVTSGPYKVEKRIIGDSIKTVPNEYYGIAERTPLNTSVTYKVVPEASSRTIMVESGDADIACLFQSSDYARVKDNPDLKVLSEASSKMYYMSMDTQGEYFSNKLVRQAVNYAVDREAICLMAFEGFAQPFYSYTAPTCTTYVENPCGYTYDPVKAKELLAEAGYPDGFSTTMVVSNETGTNVAEMVQSYLAEIGIQTEIQLVEDTSLYCNMATAGELPLGVATWSCMADPGYFVARNMGEAGLGAYSFARWDNDYTNGLINQAASTLDMEKRDELFTEYINILCEECPWCPIVNPEVQALVRSDLQGVRYGCTSQPAEVWALHY